MIGAWPDRKQCVVAVSFSNYLSSVGGMSKYMMAHERMYTEKGFSYISVYFVKKQIRDRYQIFTFYGLIVDGKEAGVFTVDELIRYFQTLKTSGYSINDIHLHNVSYMNSRHMMRIMNAMPQTPVKLIIHDFHTVCASINLMKNGTIFCGGKVPCEDKCKDCRSFAEAKDYVADVRRLMYYIKDRLTVISPSEVAKKIWLEAYPDFENQVVVVTEQLHRGEYLGNRAPINGDKKVVIGYLGNKAPHKGWLQWSSFVEQAHEAHDRYRCVVFNSMKNFDDPYMEHCSVRFTSENLNAMIAALRNEKVDCAILWSICPETYSYTLFEACAANVFIITNRSSGNIAYTVQMNKNGMVLDSTEELNYFAKNPEELVRRINEFRTASRPGPENLIDNYEFLEWTKSDVPFCVNYRKSNLIYRLTQKFLLIGLKLLSRMTGIKL